MKKYVTMIAMNSSGYQKLERMDSIFYALTRIFSDKFKPNQLISWFMNEKRTV